MADADAATAELEPEPEPEPNIAQTSSSPSSTPVGSGGVDDGDGDQPVPHPKKHPSGLPGFKVPTLPTHRQEAREERDNEHETLLPGSPMVLRGRTPGVDDEPPHLTSAPAASGTAANSTGEDADATTHSSSSPATLDDRGRSASTVENNSAHISVGQRVRLHSLKGQ